MINDYDDDWWYSKPFLPRWHPLYGENTGDGPPQFVPLPSQKELRFVPSSSLINEYVGRMATQKVSECHMTYSEYLKMFKRLDRDCNGQLG